eukprot:c32396_g1_i1.p1 GENE.c32396_g1_i1~~c32396_g1_i1.p1  ORF type:complete len:610 (+),score=131.26 c32396_g1_i1:72-1901(+)
MGVVGWRDVGRLLWCPGDIEAFIALFTNNLATLIVVISSLLQFLPRHIVYDRVLPGTGLAMFVGNMWYAFQAYRQQRRGIDVCAQPYGINTPGTLVFVFSILLPAYNTAQGTEADRAEFAWRVGVACNLLSGLIEVACAVTGKLIQRVTPPVALLSSLGGLGLVYLVLSQLLDGAAEPMVGLLPLAVAIVGYFGHVKFGRIPVTVVVVLVGCALGWAVGVSTAQDVRDSTKLLGWNPPRFTVTEIISSLKETSKYLSVVVPVALTVAVGTIQCVESAAQGGDEFSLRESMIADGFGTVAGAACGSCLSMTVYIGQPAFKKMGGRIGYSILNALVFVVICFSGSASLLANICCVQAFEPVIAFVGLIIASEAFVAANTRHYVAILFGFVPTLAEFAFQSVGNNVAASYVSSFNLAQNTTISFVNTTVNCNGNSRFTYANGVCTATLSESGSIQQFGSDRIQGLNYTGLVALGSGGVLVSLLFTAIAVLAIDRKFMEAGLWCIVSVGLALFGIIHGDRVEVQVQNNELAWHFAVGYAQIAVLFVGLWVAQRFGYVREPIPDDADLLSWLSGKSFNPMIPAELNAEDVPTMKKRHSEESLHRHLIPKSSFLD